jgi:hypothetical protein
MGSTMNWFSPGIPASGSTTSRNPRKLTVSPLLTLLELAFGRLPFQSIATSRRNNSS